jgi:hypothetical protein
MTPSTELDATARKKRSGLDDGAIKVDQVANGEFIRRGAVQGRHLRRHHHRGHRATAKPPENARLIVSQIVLDTLQELKMNYPKTSATRRRELQLIRKQLAK